MAPREAKHFVSAQAFDLFSRFPTGEMKSTDRRNTSGTCFLFFCRSTNEKMKMRHHRSTVCRYWRGWRTQCGVTLVCDFPQINIHKNGKMWKWNSTLVKNKCASLHFLFQFFMLSAGYPFQFCFYGDLLNCIFLYFVLCTVRHTFKQTVPEKCHAFFRFLYC